MHISREREGKNYTYNTDVDMLVNYLTNLFNIIVFMFNRNFIKCSDKGKTG